ncbi:MAG: 2-oxoisovalerate dehydrogenase [Candidatus Lloydbacteria bacterium RIFCSPHIGHO2_01_FULL_54_11]|nr:MAG: 2-oxoisovalerate dehydrogenase [Candidatus Lloydbacteria bacterium RIFCSPHIGHO2_01_FULL_54_11]OGZ16388.1 MAG: 2-oxoisovalerate dehydrogenase [Candidatus Lloydbacteria bacterium RIFCSPLOWO2_02_FULL_54_12]
MVIALGNEKGTVKGSAGAITMVEALNLAFRHELKRDKTVALIGEDIGGKKGGVFLVTKGLAEEFGVDRVENSRLDEATLAGYAVGMAIAGVRVIVEFQFAGFSYAGFEHIVSHAARMRHRTRGKFSCPMVIRMPYGAGVQSPEHHLESPEALFAHIPGLRVVIPSSPKSAYGLMLAAIRNNDPVVFLEPTRMYHDKDDVEDDGVALALDRALVEREGKDVTLIAWGAMMREARKAADVLDGEGVSVEVIDVATVTPLDFDTIHRSVEKTGRVVILHEAAGNGGYGAEIAARLAEKTILSLLAPIRRVTAPDVIPPYTRRDADGHPRSVIPKVDDVLRALRETVRFGS